MAAGARDDRRAAPRVDAKAVRATRRAASPSIRCFVSGAQRSSASLHTGEAERQSKRSCSPQPIQAVAPPPKALGSHGLPKEPSPRSSAPGPGRKTSVRLRYKRVKRAFRKLRGFFSDRLVFSTPNLPWSVRSRSGLVEPPEANRVAGRSASNEGRPVPPTPTREAAVAQPRRSRPFARLATRAAPAPR